MFFVQSLPTNHYKSIPTVVKSNSKNICYIWDYLRLKLGERKIKLCAMSVLQRLCHSRLYLHSVQIPITIADDENIVTYIHLWNSCIPTSKKKFRHNS